MSLSVRAAAHSGAALRTSERSYERGISRMSSGVRIQRAADDAAGLAISERMRAQVGGSVVATRNAHDGISLLQTADGGLEAITSMLQRARELAVQAASTGTMTQGDRDAAAAEVRQLVAEIDRTAGTTSYNGHRMLDGSRPSGYAFQVGASAGDGLTASAFDVTAGALGLSGTSAVAASASSWLQSRTVTTQAAESAACGTYTQTKYQGNGRSFQVRVDGVQVDDFKVAGGIYTATTLAAAFDAGITDSRVTVREDAGRVVVAMSDPRSTAQVTVTGQDADGPTLAFRVRLGTHTYDELVSTTIAAASAVASLAELVAAGDPDALGVCDDALDSVSSARSEVGLAQNRMEHRLGLLAATELNLRDARSRLADADMAKEWAGVVRAQLLTQAGLAMQAQSPAGGQRVVQLLGSL